jgi:aryl-alcohol dehydrogenase-like predicted oxidoreductase
MATITMPQRPLGKSGATVSAMGLGCMTMSSIYAAGAGDEPESLATIARAIELGITFIDTADAYGAGQNEELVGRAIAAKREDVFLATKFGNLRNPDGTFKGVSGTPAYVKEACDASLKRLNVDVIDLFYQHRVDPATPIEDTIGALAELVKAGKIRYIGMSEAAPETLRRAYAVHPIAALQTEYSLWTRDVETDGVLATARELGVAFVAYSPLGRGFLSGAFRDPEVLGKGDSRKNQPRFSADNLVANLKLADAVKAIADRKGCSPAQLSLAWLMAQDGVIPIPGTKRVSHLEDNAAAVNVTLSAADLAEIDAALPAGAAVGTRYPAMQMGSVRI